MSGTNKATQTPPLVGSGYAADAEQWLPLLYDELRQLAAAKLRQERPGQTLQPTALVHEAYLRLIGVAKPQQWQNAGHFFAAAAEAMRRILIERARHKHTLKAGGLRVDLPEAEFADAAANDPVDVLALNDALEELEQSNARRAGVVKLRFFAGLTIEQTAAALGISPSTADNDWAYAKTWLRVRMTQASEC